MLEQITGFSTIFAGTREPSASEAVAIAAILGVIVWCIILGIAYLVLAVISCFRQKLPLSEIVGGAFRSFGQLWRQMLKYYIPLIILSFAGGVSILLINLFNYLVPFGTGLLPGLFLLVLSPLFLALAIYMGVLDSSLAKSYYTSLKTGKFRFSWISFGEFMRVIGVGFLYFVLIMASVLLLGIPLIFLPAISLFLRFPLLNEGKGIVETMSKLLSMLRKDFWNIFFFYFIYSLAAGLASGITQVMPVIGYMASALIVAPLSTLLSAQAYFLLNNRYEKEGKKAPKKIGPSARKRHSGAAA